MGIRFGVWGVSGLGLGVWGFRGWMFRLQGLQVFQRCSWDLGFGYVVFRDLVIRFKV